MNDNITRGFRLAIQAGLGVLATGGLTKIWESFTGSHVVDPTIQVGVGIVCIAVVGWAQAVLEDMTGKGLLVPQDRQVGDAVLDSGIGEKKWVEGALPRKSNEALVAVGMSVGPSRHSQARY